MIMDSQLSTQVPELRTYLIGFVLALVLTAIPFGLVYFKLLPATWTIGGIAIAAVVQIMVHLRFFLHINFRHTPGENILALCFTALLILIMVGGSLWIMFDLHYRMMP